MGGWTVKAPEQIATDIVAKRVRGPVELLCNEIGFAFHIGMERTEVIVAFVAELIAVIRHDREFAIILGGVTGVSPSEGSGEVLALCDAMLAEQKPEKIITAAEVVHEACCRLNPDEAYPTDHTIDMLSSCASALRFSLETPCRSRHAAEASNHVWRRTYGVSRFDQYTPEWSKSWARSKLQEAIIGYAVRAILKEQADAK